MSRWRYFSEEADPILFQCQETGEYGISYYFVDDLDLLRKVCGFPFVISSGYRSVKHSLEAVKDQPGTHTQGIAADIIVHDGIQRGKIVENAINLGFKGIGIAKTFMHVDKREGELVIWTYGS